MASMAIATGNAVIVKPSERVLAPPPLLGESWTSRRVCRAGVWNTVNGDATAVDAMFEHPGIAAISFVGSTRIGEHIYQHGSRHNKRVAAYTGGKNFTWSSCRMPISTPPRRPLSKAGYGSSSQRCMAVRFGLRRRRDRDGCGRM